MSETKKSRAWCQNASNTVLSIQNAMIESVNNGFTGWDTVEQLTREVLTEKNNTMNNVLASKVSFNTIFSYKYREKKIGAILYR